MDSPYTQRLQAVRAKLDQNKPASGLKDELKKLKAKQSSYAADNAPPSQIPWSAAAETQVGTLNRDRDFYNTNANVSEARLRNEYGFDDASNPYSRANLLQRQYQQARNQTTNSYAAAGQLYSGAVNNARDLDAHNFNEAWNRQKTAYLQGLEDINLGRAQAQRTADEGIIGAQAQALEDALQTTPDPSESPAEAAKKKHDKDKKKGKGK